MELMDRDGVTATISRVFTWMRPPRVEFIARERQNYQTAGWALTWRQDPGRCTLVAKEFCHTRQRGS